MFRITSPTMLTLAAGWFVLPGALAPSPALADDKPPVLESVLEGYEKVPAADGGDKSLYTLYLKKDTHDLLAVLPPDFERQRILLTNTLAGGFPSAGIQNYADFRYWKRYGNRLALMEPDVEMRTTGDLESRRSLETLYADRVKLDVPIVAEGPGGAPVIDLDALFIDQTAKFHQFQPGGLEPHLGTIESIKAFAENISLSVQMPWRMPEIPQDDGTLVTLTYSISLLPEKPDYTPREADARVGYFITSHDDLGRFDETRVRYIKRWSLQKADPSLALSPPREPIVFYIDHKTPIRYRRWVRDGILAWNKAFEEVGIVNAIEVYQQDARSGAHMEKHPEDVHHNFVVWNSNNWSFAIGPCRVDPRTGQILDADVVFNDGWIRFGVDDFRTYIADIALEDMSAETRQWLKTRPQWDPRVRLADAGDRSDVAAQHATGGAAVNFNHAKHGTGYGESCQYGTCRAIDLSLARFSLLDLGAAADDGTIDDVPDEFIGEMVRDVIMHEVGHVLGLRHNFKGSSTFALDDINSAAWRDKDRPISGSVMDYNAFNYHTGEGDVHSPHFMTALGPYDLWAIRYGYGVDADLASILGESGRPEHAFLTDEDLYGPDPAAQSRDLGRDSLNFVDAEMALVQRLRERIPQRALAEGKAYQRGRDAYMTLLLKHAGSLAIASRYIGGVSVHRDRVGDAERPPTEVVPVVEQRRALEQVIRYAFLDEAFGLTPELLDIMSYDKWMDDRIVPQGLPDPQLDVHDLVLGVQAARLTVLFSPTRLRRIVDNELRVPPDTDAFTLVELFDTVQVAIWRELNDPANDTWTARKPLISSLRRNLQREHLERLIDLTMPGGMTGAAAKPVATLAAAHLRELQTKIARQLDQTGDRLDAYSRAHLDDANRRIEQALHAMYIIQ